MTLTNHIRITLGEHEYELKPSLKAANAVSSRYNGFLQAQQVVLGNDLGAISYIIRQGVAVRTISTDDLNEAIYDAGTRNLIDPVFQYVRRLANGGRDPDETDAEDDDASEDRHEGNGEL